MVHFDEAIRKPIPAMYGRIKPGRVRNGPGLLRPHTTRYNSDPRRRNKSPLPPCSRIKYIQSATDKHTHTLRSVNHIKEASPFRPDPTTTVRSSSPGKQRRPVRPAIPATGRNPVPGYNFRLPLFGIHPFSLPVDHPSFMTQRSAHSVQHETWLPRPPNRADSLS